MGFIIQRSDIESVISNVPGAIERVLYLVYTKILKFQQNQNQTQSLSLANKLSESPNNSNGFNMQNSILKRNSSIEE